MKSKKGLSLLVLTITIMVMILLASIVVFTAATTTNNSKKAAFASDLEQIENLVKEYYLANGNLPIVTGGTEYSKTTFTNLITDGKSSLEEEISENGDNSAVFYKLDLSKLEIETTKRGLEAEGDTTDVYFLASGTFNVYYLHGEEIADEYYFSLSERLTGKLKVANSQTLDTSSITVSSATGAIKLTKSTAEYTNALTVDVKVNLEAGETMKYTIAGQGIAVATGATTIDIANVISNNSTLQTAFYQSEENKYLLAQKYSGGKVIAEVKINIANLDILSGNVSSVSISYSKYDKFTLAKISGYADLGGSGLKEVRVLYTTKTSGEAYYTNLPTTITNEYVRQSGKAFGSTTLKLPTDVYKFALVFIDNAGNITEVGNYEASIIPAIGDKVTGYTLASKSETPKSSETGLTTNLSISNQTNLIWRYIGTSEDGKLLIAPDVTEDVPQVSLANKEGVVKGIAELDRLCSVLYTTNKGTAISMNIDDVIKLLGYIGSKGGYRNQSGNWVTTSNAKTIGTLENELGISLSETNRTIPDNNKVFVEYLANAYTIDKTSSVTEMTYPDRVDLVCFNTSYWLASSSCRIDFRNGLAEFCLRCVNSAGVGNAALFRSSDKSVSFSSGIRPVVALNSNVRLIKQADNVWKID